MPVRDAEAPFLSAHSGVSDLLHQEYQLDLLAAAQDGGFDFCSWRKVVKQAADQFTLALTSRRSGDLNDDISFLEAGFLGGGMLAILADVFCQQSKLVGL